MNHAKEPASSSSLPDGGYVITVLSAMVGQMAYVNAGVVMKLDLDVAKKGAAGGYERLARAHQALIEASLKRVAIAVEATEIMIPVRSGRPLRAGARLPA